MLTELLILQQTWTPALPELWEQVRQMSGEQLALEAELIHQESKDWDNTWLEPENAWLTAQLPSEKHSETQDESLCFYEYNSQGFPYLVAVSDGVVAHGYDETIYPDSYFDGGEF